MSRAWVGGSQLDRPMTPGWRNNQFYVSNDPLNLKPYVPMQPGKRFAEEAKKKNTDQEKATMLEGLRRMINKDRRDDDAEDAFAQRRQV